MNQTLSVIGGLLCLLAAAIITAVLTPLVRQRAGRWGLIDHPGGNDTHKQHEAATPLGGGVAILAGILLPILAALAVAAGLSRVSPESLPWLTNTWPGWRDWIGGVVEQSPAALAIMAGACVLHIMGLFDDRRPMSPFFKLAVQLAVALTLTAGFGIRAADALGPLPAVLITTFWIVGLTNAFNFMDNMDGLTAGVSVITACVLAVSSMVAGQVFVPCLLLMVAGASFGFLIFNRPPASIFMGDSGSLVLGYMLAVSTVLITFYDPRLDRTPFGVLVPVVVFAIPLYDMCTVLFDRIRRGVSIFRSDRRHFSHRLVERGLSPSLAVLTIYLACLATALPAIVLPFHGWLVASVIFLQCLCVVSIIAILERPDVR